MADFTQGSHTFISHAHYTNATNYVVVGTADDVQSYLSAMVHIDHAQIETNGNDPAIKYLIQVNHDPSAGNEYWRTIVELQADTAAPATTALDDAASSGQKTVPVAATTSLTIGDWIYIKDDGGAAGSEWAMVASISAGVSFDTVDNLTNAFVSGDDVYTAAERWVVAVDLEGIAHLRVICVNGDETGDDWACAAYALYATDIA